MNFLNFLNFLINGFWLFVEIKNSYMCIYIHKTLIDGIAFISNMENVMMGNYYVMENMQKDKNLIIKQNENFKVLINNYILKEYYVLKNVSFIRPIQENEMISLIKNLLLNFEALLIGFQKFVYEYVNYLKYLFNWYNNFKILIDKSIINSNIKEELYYNISLELLSDAQNEHNRSLWWTLQNVKNLNKNVLIQLVKNYFKVFNENPYRVSMQLMHLYKNYSKINILSYGLNYDINILTHNKHVLSKLNADILSSKTIYFNSNKVVKGIDKEQHFILNNTSIWKSKFRKKNSYFFKVNQVFSDYMTKFIKDRWVVSGTFANKTYTLTRLKLLNNSFFNFEFLNDSILVRPWSNYNLKARIYYPDGLVFKPAVRDYVFDRIKWNFFRLHQPDIAVRFLQSIARFFAGTKEHIDPSKISTNVIGGSNEILNLQNISKTNLSEDAINLLKLRKLYGGYTYWWAWHQDATFLYETPEEKGWFINEKLPQKVEHYVMGYKPIYFKLAVISDMKIDVGRFFENQPKYMLGELSRAMSDYRTTVSEVDSRIKEIDDLLDPNSGYSKKYAEYKNRNKAPAKKKIYVDEGAAAIDEIMYDGDIDKMIYDKQHNTNTATRMGSKVTKNLPVGKMRSVTFKNAVSYDSEEYKKALEMERIRELKDPLHLYGHRYPKAYKLHYLTSIPELSGEKKFMSGEKKVMSYMEWKFKKMDDSMKKLLKGFKRKQKWHFRWKRYYGNIERFIDWRHWARGEGTVRRRLVLHGNIGLQVTKNYFKTFLVANDIWADVSFLKKSDLLKKFRPYKKFLGKDYTKYFVKKVMTVTPDVRKSFGKFVNLRNFAKYNNAYTKFVNLELKNHAANVVYWNILHKSDFLYKYILNGNIYDKKWLQEVKNVSWSYMIEKLPKEPKPFKTIKDFRFRNQDLLQMKVKYNTPIKYKKIPINWHTKVIRSQAQVKVKYIVPRKWFERFFYPEISTRVKAVKFRKRDVIFELNMPKVEFKKLRSEIKFDYNPKMKFDVYKNIIQRNFNKKWLRTKDMTQISFKGIRGFLMFMFNYDVFANTEYLSTMHYLRKNTVTWGNFYHTNIESITEPLNLNFIHKTFYGKHVNKGFNYFLYKKVDLVTNTTLPKTRNILLKKAYIRNLIYVYEKEDKPMINYILYIIKREEIKIIHKFIVNIFNILWDDIYACFKAFVKSYKFLGEFFLKLIKQELLKFREARRLKHYFEQHPEYITYIIILGLFFIYTIICIFLILIIKTFLPKNLIYGKIFIKDIKNSVDLYHNKNNNAEDIKLKYSKNFIETISELEDIMDIKFDKKSIHNEIKDDMLAGEVNDITIDNLKKLELYVKLKKSDKLKIKKNFFDPEHKYVYSWENKDFNLLEEIKKAKILKKIIPLEDKRFLKKRIYTTKFEEKKVNDLKKKYIVFYKAFIFEKNLEKWEDNTKRRLDFFFRKENKGIVRLLLTDLWRSFIDRRFNHNRMLFWDNPDLEDTSRITYMFAMYKPFFNIFFILKFILASLKLWDYNYWMTKWRQYVMFGVHANINYKEIRGRLEKDWSLEWFKEEADYGRIHFKDLVKVIKKYEEIKKLDPDSPAFEKKKVREKILSKILDLTSEKNKLKQVRTYLLDLKTIKSDRVANGFDAKFKDMATKLILDIDKIGPYKWAEQSLRFKYRNEVYEQKLKIVKEEYETLKKSFTSRVKRDLDDKEWTLQTIHWRDDKKIKLIMKQKIAAVEHEKNVREYNYHNKFIDSALDAKDKIYYEAIKEYNHELSEEHLNIKKEEADEKLEETKYEKKSRRLFGILEQNYIYFRWFTTMGTRFNYIFVLIVGIFAGWWDNIKKIGKNEFTISTLFLVIKADLFKYIYKIYWEYLILWNKRKASQKLGFSIKEILKFAIILTPLFLYSTFLYSIFFIYFILFIILFILPKKIYINLKVKIGKIIKKVLIKKIINVLGIIFNYFMYIWKIINFLFKDMDGNTLWTQLYTKFYKFCGWLQYNVYMFKGAFILGYTNNNNDIKKGLISIFNLLKLKCTSYLEQRKVRKKYKVKYKPKKLWLFFTFKLHFIMALIPYQSYLAVAKKKLVYYYYHFLIKKFLRLEKDEFIRIFKNNIALFKQYFIDIIEIIINTKNASVKDILILIVKTIWRLLILPIKFVINHQKIKYIKNYKQGIQGFRDNPMYLILDNPKRKNNWKLKLHKILMEQEISYYLKDLLDASNTMIDIFFIFKIHEVKWTNKNYYQDFFWRKSYWEYKKIKKSILNFLIDLAVKFEENYASFEQNIETRNWTLWERCKYAFYTYRLYIHGMSRKSQQRKSRDLFFYKKAKDKSKIMRSYFIKGVINWITYITLNKVIFTKIHNLKSKKTVYKYMKYKYKLKDIEAKIYTNNNIHLTEQLKNTPPQLWSLIIMYEIYYKTLLRYRYEDENFPTKWVDGSDLQKKDYKWRLSAPEHIWDVPFYDRRFIAADINSFQFIDFVETLATEPYDPLLRWIIFLMEYGMATEDIIGLGEEVWLKSDNDRAIWADISLTHLLTYNKKLDEYKYEIRDFNRLIKGVDVLRVAENTLQRDKLKHYEDRFKLVSNAILTENEDILKDMLKERRTIRAKMLHRSLARNRLKTRYEVDQELAKEQEREFYFAKKREFFEELLIEEFWDWQAEYDEGAPEDKYFNSHDIFRKTEEAHIFEEYFLQNRKRLPYNYLLNNIVLKSFDQTIEEIHYFLTFKVWKILEKSLKKNKKIIEINYKNLNISNKFLSRLNYDVHITSKVKWVHDKKTKKDDPQYYYDYKYKKLEWEPSKQEALYGFMETNILAEYSEAGEYYTYNTKIEYNEEALKYSRPPKLFHGQRLLMIWMKMISKRHKTLRNIKKKSIKRKRKLPLNIAYINNIKWTWEQWLIYTDVDYENELLNRNTVILNERFHLWNLKRVPIRVKVPVSLTVDIDEISEYIGKKSNYMSFMNHRHIMMLSDIAPMLKQGIVWEECKKMLEKRFNRDIQELVLWIFTAEAFNTEVNQITHDYQFVLKNFIQNYGVFHKLYFIGMPQYTWDLIRYHEAWWGRDEFPYDKYYQLKQIEFLNHDPAAKKIVRRLYQLYLDKYSPISFTFFFKNQYFAGYWYKVYGILAIISFVWTIKVLMYNPGEFISENYLLFTPMLLTIAFCYLRWSVKKIKDIQQGEELYLYKYHESNAWTPMDLIYRKERMEKKKKEWTEHFYDADKLQELFPEGLQSISTDINPDWWRHYTHRNKYSEIYNHGHAVWWMWAFGAYFLSEYWKFYKFKYHNSKWLWDYYRYDEELVKELIAKGIVNKDIRAPQNYKEKQWFFDSWWRLENGGNWYSRWYENHFRKLWKLDKKELDYGFDWQKISNVDMPIRLDRKVYHFPGAVADVNWITLSRTVENYNKLPDEIKDLKKVIRLKQREKGDKYLSKRERRSRRWQKKWEREKYNRIFDDVHTKKYDSEREITNLEILKGDIIYFKNEAFELFKRWYYRDRYIAKFHPLAKWGEFLFWVQDNIGFDTTGNVYARFLLNAKKETKKLIRKDLMRHKTKKDADVERILNKINIFNYEIFNFEIFNHEIFNFIKIQKVKRAKDLILTKSKCFYKGESMDMRTLLSISDSEMHIAQLRYVLLKHKQSRILRKIFNDQAFYINNKNKIKFKKRWISELDGLSFQVDILSYIQEHYYVKTTPWAYYLSEFSKYLLNFDKKRAKVIYLNIRLKKMKEIDLNKKLYAENLKKLKRYRDYLKDIPRRTQITERNEYRYNVMINFLKKKEDVWIFLKDFFFDISLEEFGTFVIKIITKIFE